MPRILYLHGYGSNGMATKGQLLRQMYPEALVMSPTLDYNHLTPRQILGQIEDIVRWARPDLIVGSSLGGYYTLCSTSFYDGPVWCINPVREVVKTIGRVITSRDTEVTRMMELYKEMDTALFQQLHPRDGQLHFALSTDDELLGDHHPLLALFPNYAQVVWKDLCGHRFLRFAELKEEMWK